MFKINPSAIDRSKFKKFFDNRVQENIRTIIDNALTMVDKYPEKYDCTFYTLMPKKIWDSSKTAEELIDYATELGGYMGDWVEQALEWAQRICNGESWEDICNKPDTANWTRMVVWHGGFVRLIVGSKNDNNNFPPTHIDFGACYGCNCFWMVIPFVVIKNR